MIARLAIVSVALLALAPLASCAAPPFAPEPIGAVAQRADGDPCVPGPGLPACDPRSIGCSGDGIMGDDAPCSDQQEWTPGLGGACSTCCYQVDPTNPTTYSAETVGCL